jgi:hypothetical protein
MKVQQFILSNRVKVTFLPATYTFEIDGKIFEADWEENFTDREVMLEHAREQICIEFAEVSNDEEHDALIDALENIKL